MKTFIFNFILLFIIFLNKFKKIICEEQKLISIPFSIKHVNHSENYNSTNFINDYYIKEFILKLSIGTPPQRVNCLIDTVSICFQFIEDNSDKIINNERYYPNKSFSLIKIKYNKKINEDFNFEENMNNYTLEVIIDNNKINRNNTYIAKLGLNVPLLKGSGECPNFFLSLKKKEAINKLIWTIEYTKI